MTLPTDPLSRFLELAKALTGEKRWWEDRSLLRYAALPLVTATGDVAKLARRSAAVAETLRAHASWASEMRSTLRHVLAAFVVAGGRDAKTFAAACAQTRERFRAASVRRGGPYELVAAAMLHVAGAESPTDVARLQQIYAAMKAHSWWLTGPEDLPACALLAVHGGDVAGLSQRIEAIYEKLREGDMPARDGTQMAAHVLCLAAGTSHELSGRFLQLHHGFVDAGIAMWDCDRDELALLCLLDQDAARTIATVVEHRARIRRELAHVGPTTSFTYACGTAFLDALAGKPPDAALHRLVLIANLAMATNAATAVQQQRASAASAAS